MLYKDVCLNLRKIDEAIDQIQLDLRRYISMGQDNNVYTYTKIFSYLVTCWTEVRVLKLAYESAAFDEDETKLIINAQTLKDMWLTALNIAFCKAYNLKKTNSPVLLQQRLKPTPRFRYQEIKDLIEKDLVQSIELRNRIAHGQWLIAFNSELTNKNDKLTGQLRVENIVQLQHKRNILKSLSQIIHDLAVSTPTFEKNFDKNYEIIEQQRNKLIKKDAYKFYIEKMKEKYQRGIKKRNA